MDLRHFMKVASTFKYI